MFLELDRKNKHNVAMIDIHPVRLHSNAPSVSSPELRHSPVYDKALRRGKESGSAAEKGTGKD